MITMGDADSAAEARTPHSPDGSADRLTAEVSAASHREPAGVIVRGSAEYKYLATDE